MSADILRRAAVLLRERAEKATHGPWQTAIEIDGWRAGRRTVVRGPGMRVVTVDQTRPHHAEGEENVAYIATMHPGVGLALADWLDDLAEALDGFTVMQDHRALRVARQILGES